MILLRRCYRIFTGVAGAENADERIGLEAAARAGARTGKRPEAKSAAAAIRRAAGSDLAGLDILIEGNRIAAIGRDIETPGGAEIIDASRHVVLPGLVNTHHHSTRL